MCNIFGPQIWSRKFFDKFHKKYIHFRVTNHEQQQHIKFWKDVGFAWTQIWLRRNVNQGLAARYVGVSYFHINSSQMEKRGDESPYNIYLPILPISIAALSSGLL